MYKLIIFDLDGTIFDTIPLIVETYLKTYERFGLVPPSLEHIRGGIGLPLVQYIAMTVPEPLREDFRNAFKAYNESHLDTNVGIYVGIWPILKKIERNGIPMGIMTSKRRNVALRSLRTFGLDPYFRWVRGAEDSQEHKPSPLPLLETIAVAEADMKIQLSPAEVLYIGDNTMDVECSDRAGCPCAIVGWSGIEDRQLDAAGSWFRLDGPDDLKLQFT